MTLVVVLLGWLPPPRVAGNWLHDLGLTGFSPSVSPSGDAAVVAIDEETLAGPVYRAPVERALLVDRIAALERRALA